MSVGYIPSPPVLLSKLSSPPLAPYLCSIFHIPVRFPFLKYNTDVSHILPT